MGSNGGGFSAGTVVGGKYRLQKQIGEGAMGVVWSAVNSATNGLVALKLILKSDPELQHRLKREAHACGGIRHRNVVQVYDVGTIDNGDPFLVMELLHGETLAALLARKRRLPADEAASIGRDVARALDAAHRAGIVHRDLKPANIFLHTEPGDDTPTVKVVDFGVSKNLHESDGLRTVAGGAVGSPMYMSPEQARAERDLDSRADLWSLGVVLYEMLTGERPFSGDSMEVVLKITSDPIPRAAKRVRKIDPDLDRIVAGCLTRNRDDRLGPASEIARQLDRHTQPGAREPLPSYAEGELDGAVPSSGAAASSPGLRRSGASPSGGSGATALRPDSSGARLGPSSSGHGTTALSPAASAAAALHRSGSWSDWSDAALATDDDAEQATLPFEPKMVAPRRSNPHPPSRPEASSRPPEPDLQWNAPGGGTVPIQTLLANPSGITLPLSAAAPSAGKLSAPGRGGTMRMTDADHEKLAGIAMTQPMPPVDVPVLAAARAPANRASQPKEVPRAAIAIAIAIVTAALLAVLLWVLVFRNKDAPPSAGTTPSGAPDPGGTAAPPAVSSSTPTVGTSVAQSEPGAAGAGNASGNPSSSPTPPAGSTTSAATSTPPAPSTAATLAKPAPTAPKPAPKPTGKAGGATAKPTSTATTTCGKFGMKCKYEPGDM